MSPRDPHDLDEEWDERLFDVLRLIEVGAVIEPSTAMLVRERMFGAYDELSAAESAMAGQSKQAEIVEVAFEDPGRAGRQIGRGVWLLAAAALVLIAFGALRFDGGPEAERRLAPASDVAVQPTLLPAGRHLSAVLGPQVSFQTDLDLWVVREDGTRIELTVDPDDGSAARLILLRPQSIEPALGTETLAQYFSDRGEVGVQSMPQVVDGADVPAWRGPLPDSEIQNTGCQNGEFCIPVVSTDIVEVTLDDGSSLLLVSVPGDRTVAFGAPFTSILNSFQTEVGG